MRTAYLPRCAFRSGGTSSSAAQDAAFHPCQRWQATSPCRRHGYAAGASITGLAIVRWPITVKLRTGHKQAFPATLSNVRICRSCARSVDEREAVKLAGSSTVRSLAIAEHCLHLLLDTSSSFCRPGPAHRTWRGSPRRCSWCHHPQSVPSYGQQGGLLQSDYIALAPR
jgi:hypothetical protein